MPTLCNNRVQKNSPVYAPHLNCRTAMSLVFGTLCVLFIVLSAAGQDPTFQGPEAPAPPSSEPSTAGGESNCDDSGDATREFLSRMQAVQDQLTSTREAMEQAVEAKRFAEAAEHQARELELTTQRDELRQARVALCGAANRLEPAGNMEAVVARAWQARLDELMEPLEPAINTTLAIVQQSLRHAAAAGHTGIQIGEANLLQQSYVPDDCTSCYSVDLGFCKLLIAPDLTEEQLSEFYQGRTQPPTQRQGNSYDGVAVAAEALPAAVVEGEVAYGRPPPPPPPPTPPGCSEATASALTATFDANTLHAYADYERVMRSKEGRLQLQWRLHEAGFDMAFAVPPEDWPDSQNPLLAVQYGEVREKLIAAGLRSRSIGLGSVPNPDSYRGKRPWTFSPSDGRYGSTGTKADRVFASASPASFLEFVRLMLEDDIRSLSVPE
jgi:hypothetical protein